MKLLKWLDENFEECLLLIFLCIMVATMGLQIIARYVFSSSLSWSEEVTRYLFVCSGFLSASYCRKKNITIRVDQILNLISGKKRHVAILGGYTVEFMFFAYLTPFAYSLVMSSVESGQTTAALGLPMWIIQSSTLLCCVLTSFRVAQKWLEHFRLIIADEKWL